MAPSCPLPARKHFADGLAAALAKISERTASFSNAGASDSTQLNSGTLIFTASYVSGRWTGLLRAESAVSGTEVWKTTNAGLIPAYGSRNIFTRSGTLTGGVGAGGVGGGTTFPTSAQQGALVRTGGPANYEVSGADNALYIKGNQSKEGSTPGKLRVRSTLMGDIVNSSPAYVADSEHGLHRCPTTACCTPSTRAPAQSSSPTSPTSSISANWPT